MPRSCPIRECRCWSGWEQAAWGIDKGGTPKPGGWTSQKSPWWAVDTTGECTEPTIQGRRVDAPAPPLRARIGSGDALDYSELAICRLYGGTVGGAERQAGPASGQGMGMEPLCSPARVARSYDRLAARYAQWADRVTPPLREHYTEVLSARLPAGARVLELGCGPGVPVARMLSRRFAVVGVDISPQMVHLARRNAPQALFLQADMASVALRPASFAGVVAFYSLIHVPRVHHAGLLARVRRWLRPGGVLVASLGCHDLPVGTDPDWLGGGPMHWSFFDAQTNLRLLREAGLQVEEAKVVPQLEDEVQVSFLWVVAHKPAGHNDDGAA